MSFASRWRQKEYILHMVDLPIEKRKTFKKSKILNPNSLEIRYIDLNISQLYLFHNQKTITTLVIIIT